MNKCDEQNIELATSPDAVDEANAGFYGTFTFPWQPMKFDRLLDPYFAAKMLNQGLGGWTHEIVPPAPRVWVAGCGANQALITALKFTKGSVIGSDLSAESLAFCADTARQLGVTNLELRRESINHVSHREQFDYVICTGVIHHNAEPHRSLARLAEALKPSGILELMVYNRYHRIHTSTFQRAIRLLRGSGGVVDYASELSFAKKFIGAFRADNSISQLLKECAAMPDSAIADTLIQPVEYSYTVETLAEMAAGCGLELLLPCVNAFDRAWQTTAWRLELGDEELQRSYDALDDVERWQVTNLLLAEKSPMLWFYLQRKDSGRVRKTERQVCDEFLGAKFVRSRAQCLSYVLSDENVYRPAPAPRPPAPPLTDPLLGRIVELCEGTRTVGEVLRELKVEATFSAVNHARVRLTTPTFPYLTAVPPATAKSTPPPAAGLPRAGMRKALGRVELPAGEAGEN